MTASEFFYAFNARSPVVPVKTGTCGPGAMALQPSYGNPLRPLQGAASVTCPRPLSPSVLFRQPEKEARNTPKSGMPPMSHCDPSWPASTMSQMSHFPNFCDITLATNPCHTVRVSGQLAQCHRCHTFQLQKRVFSYDRCDIVTSHHPNLVITELQ